MLSVAFAPNRCKREASKNKLTIARRTLTLKTKSIQTHINYPNERSERTNERSGKQQMNIQNNFMCNVQIE